MNLFNQTHSTINNKILQSNLNHNVNSLQQVSFNNLFHILVDYIQSELVNLPIFIAV